jgi:hypothetical protein
MSLTGGHSAAKPSSSFTRPLPCLTCCAQNGNPEAFRPSLTELIALSPNRQRSAQSADPKEATKQVNEMALIPLSGSQKLNLTLALVHSSHLPSCATQRPDRLDLTGLDFVEAGLGARRAPSPQSALPNAPHFATQHNTSLGRYLQPISLFCTSFVSHLAHVISTLRYLPYLALDLSKFELLE